MGLSLLSIKVPLPVLYTFLQHSELLLNGNHSKAFSLIFLMPIPPEKAQLWRAFKGL
jgi:hypothetical protein